jgi:Cys-rich repeat protein
LLGSTARAEVGLVKLASPLTLALLLALDGCGGKAAAYEYTSSVRGAPAAGGEHAASGAGNSSASGASGASLVAAGSSGDSAGGGNGGNGGEGGASAAANAGVGGQVAASGNAGAAGEGAAAGASGTPGAAGTGGAKACASVTECPTPNACFIARCSAGSCGTDYVPVGALHVLDAPADCHATTACDGFGHPTLAVDQSNALTPSNQCLVGTCNDSGTVGSEPLPSGTACHADAGGGKCDGQGTCVACLASADCPLGQSCNSNRECVGEACSDVHCGGACPACVGQKCASDSDCASKACNLTTLLCIADPRCADAQQDGNETDKDCGGGSCPGCALGQACLGNADCASFACDAVSLSCVANACSDHRMDSDESDVDCGGSNASCSRCAVGKGCTSNIDCSGGHICITKACR